LEKIFTIEEINYYKKLYQKNEKNIFLASRYAAKEACYKAISSWYEKFFRSCFTRGFLLVAPKIMVSLPGNGVPELQAQGFLLELFNHNKVLSTVSLSHEKEYVVASVIIMSREGL
jgi:phosphopantetheine--protein transferase-like protein